MCGIIGVINTREENKEMAKRIFKSIVLDNEARGSHSTGVLAIRREKGSFSLFKDTVGASILMNRKKFAQEEADVWIGHCRFATTGEINERNAHPLNRNNVFLVHNGVISNHEEIGKSLNFDHKVDSEILIPIVEQEDWDLLQDIKGNANFIAWDRDKDRIYVARHDNPLWSLTLSEYGILAFSSTYSILSTLAEHYSRFSTPQEFTNNKLLTLDTNGVPIGERGLSFKEDIVIEKKSVPVKQLGYDDWEEDDDRGYINPKYYDKRDWEKSLEDLDEEMECEVCGAEIFTDEVRSGMEAWEKPLCYNCLAELEELTKGIQYGEIDLNSEPLKKYRAILEPYLG